MRANIGTRTEDGYFFLDFRTSRFIGKPLALGGSNGSSGPLSIVDTEFLAVVLPEIELGQIAVDMTLFDALIDADQPALEDREEAFKGVGVHVVARPLEFGMIDGLMLGDRRSEVVLGHVGDESAVLVDLFPNMVSDILLVDEQRPNIAATFDEAENLDVVSAAAEASWSLGLAGARQFGFVSFDGLTGTAHGAGVAGVHGMPDTMAKMPCGFHAAAEHPLKLASRYAFLAGTHQVDGLQPEPQRQMAVLENGPDADGEWLPASVALAETGPSGFAVEPADLAFIDVAAMRANGTVRPEFSFDVSERGFFIMKMWGVKNGISHV